ncbi:MAG: response regulator transcription factor [Oscillospiraceae bacterium]|nr:response regulator transcription factor [Oscillospiraceae bacterium]
MNKKLILLVEDVREVQNYNKRMLENKGFAVETAMTLAGAREFLDSQKPDIIVLDRGMPDGEGLDFLKAIRAAGSNTPVLMLTGYGETNDVITGFKTGCDDYLPKPYVFEELLMRLTRLLKSAESLPDKITKGALTLNLIAGQAFVGGEDIGLKPKEFALLLLFMENEGRTMSAEHIYEKVWNAPIADGKQTLQRRVSDLRTKLEEVGAGYTITMIYGKGYCFERG